MRVVQINMVHYGSTGKIMFQIAKTAREQGITMRTYSTSDVARRLIRLPKAPEGHSYYGSQLGNTLHHLLARYTGKSGFYSRLSTRRLIRQLKAFRPDILHLQNMHTCYLHLPTLFRYAKEANIQVIWTLHDCWAFTGRCTHFVGSSCTAWQTGCGNCPQWRQHALGPDRSHRLWQRKKDTFTSLERLTLVTPSRWLQAEAAQSFLGRYPIHVINNGIDLSIFKPTPSNFRKTHQLEDKFLLLGVAFGWTNAKGLDVFLELASRLDDRFRIVLVGTDEALDRQLPSNILSIHRTQNQQELAQIYTTCDLFVNPTREDTFPTVNAEALACGTPVLTFRTGGSPEIPDESCGCVVDCGDTDALLQQIQTICETRPYSQSACLQRAEAFNMYHRYADYVRLYQDCVKKEQDHETTK